MQRAARAARMHAKQRPGPGPRTLIRDLDLGPVIHDQTHTHICCHLALAAGLGHGLGHENRKKVYDDCYHCHQLIFHLTVDEQGAQI